MDNIINGTPDQVNFCTPFHLFVAQGKKGETGNTIYEESVRVDSMDKLAGVVVWDHTGIAFDGGKRGTERFKSSDVIILDVDNLHTDDKTKWAYPYYPNPTTQISLADALCGIPFIWVPSRNHMKPKDGRDARPKGHLYFPIQEINRPKEYSAFAAKVIKYFNDVVFKTEVFDPACKDAARFWQGTEIHHTGPKLYNKNGNENLIDFIARQHVPASGRGRPPKNANNGGEVGEPIKKGERDNTLFRFALKVLKQYGGDEDAARKMFDERVKDQQEPLTQGEVEKTWVSAVKTALCTPFLDESGKLLMPIFCDMIKKELHIKKIDTALWVYDHDTGAYVSGGTAAHGKITEFMYDKFNKLTRQKVVDGHHFILNTTPETSPTADKNMILFTNCILDLSKKWKEIKFSPKFVIRNRIPVSYNKTAAAPIVDAFLDDVTLYDNTMKNVILEGLGASMYRGVFDKAYWLMGNGRNGKSVLLEVFQIILGSDNISNVPMAYWGEKFKNACLEGKTANIVHEAGSEHIKDTTYIKSCIRGESIDIEQKNQPTRTIIPYFTSWTASNEMPVIGYWQSQEAIADRFLIIPFDAHFEAGGEKDDPDILEKLTTHQALEYWVLLGLLGLKRLLDNKGRHTTCARIDAAGRERRHEADSIAAWIDFNGYDADYINGKVTLDLYDSYKDYCVEEGRTAKTIKVFVSWIRAKYRMDSVQRRTITGRVKVFERR